MENTLINAIKKNNSWKLTENGQPALSTTLDANLDFFGTMGALRERTFTDIQEAFKAAYAENPVIAMKSLFYCRDCRGGQGERRTFKLICRWLASYHPEAIKSLMAYIPEYGRWDDLYAFCSTPLEEDALQIMKNQYNKDIISSTPSTLGKWLKSENTTSAESRLLGSKTRRFFNLTPKEYRKGLTYLRKKINVVETKMSAQEWTDINYEVVPSLAHKNYRNAFYRHDEAGYVEYLNQVQNGEAEIKSGQLFPYDLVRTYMDAYGRIDRKNPTIEAQWKAMPKYLTDKNCLVMCDVSGSMTSNNCLPLATSVGLAIKFAEENTGAFHNHYIMFSDDPTLEYVDPNMSLKEKIESVVHNEHMGCNTNLESAFDLVLNAAISDHLSQKDMPEAILVISDMEIDQATYNYGRPINKAISFTDEMKDRFEAAGYEMPTLVYWNVNARANTFHATKNDDVRFVSGSSPTIFKDLCENMGSSAIDFMLKVLSDERYSVIE